MSVAASTTGYSNSMLHTLWRLERHGQVVPNVEGLCRGVLNRQVRRLKRPLERCDYDDSLAHLLGEVVVLAERFESRPGIELGPWLHRLLTLRLFDYWRTAYGLSGEKRVVDAGVGGQALRDAGADEFDWGPFEPVDDSLEARVEDLVLGYVDLPGAEEVLVACR